MAEDRLKELVEQWLIKADHDLLIVERDIRNEAPLTDIICFHCQQAAEKYLKAFLVSKLSVPQRTHDIRTIINECCKLDPNFEKLNSCSYLSNYAVESRYPDNYYLPDKEETGKAYSDAKSIKDFVVSRITF